MTNEWLEYALAYSMAGFQVLPLHGAVGGVCTCGRKGCESAGKHPRTRRGVKDASGLEAQIREWAERMPGSNIGIATGSVSGVIVIDVDFKNGGREGIVELQRRLGPLAEQAMVSTGNGVHYYVARPSGSVRNVKLGAPGVEIKGEAGYVVAPPSVHANGKQYTWVRVEPTQGVVPCEPWRQLPALPEKWIEHIVHCLKPPRSAPREGAGEGPVQPIQAPARFPEGGRNDGLFKLGQKLVQAGISGETLVLALLGENRLRCSPPLSEDEVRGIAANAQRYTTPKETNGVISMPPNPYPWTEAGMPLIEQGKVTSADLPARTDAGQVSWIVKLFGNVLKYNFKTSQWMAFTGDRWQRRPMGRFSPEQIAIYAARLRGLVAREIKDDNARGQELTFCGRCESTNRTASIVKGCMTNDGICDSGQGWDADPDMVGVKGGVLDLRTGELKAPCPEQRVSLQAGCGFNPDADPTAWLEFLMSCCDGDAQVVDFLWRCAGYTLTGRTNNQSTFVLAGTGSNGKSTFVRLMRAAWGEYAIEAPSGAFSDEGPSSPYELAGIEGKRLATCSEMSDRKGLNVARLKSFSGEDTITVRHLYGEYYEVKPSAKLWVCTNHPLNTRDQGYAFWRRMKIIPFKRTFVPDTTKTATDLRIPIGGEISKSEISLYDRLSAGLEAVLFWAYSAVKELDAKGLCEPLTLSAEVEGAREGAGSLLEFVNECCEVGADLRCPAQALFDRYISWTEDQGMDKSERLGRVNFFRAIQGHFRIVRGRGHNYYDGVRLKDAVDAALVGAGGQKGLL